MKSMGLSFAKEHPVSEHGRYVTEQEYWDKYYEHPDFKYEWNNGQLEEVGVSDYENVKMYQWLVKLMGYYLETCDVGRMVNVEFGFRLQLPQKISVRKPDLAFVAHDNPTVLHNNDHSFKGVFDLCVELISDLSKDDIERDTVDKKKEYEDIGVKEYYILDALNRYMAFYRRNDGGFFEPIEPDKGEIIHSHVLKGFRFRLSDLFSQPLQEELVNDELYRDFVLPAYQRVKQKADEAEKKELLERQRADEAEKRALQERQNNELLKAKLRALGISIDEL